MGRAKVWKNRKNRRPSSKKSTIGLKRRETHQEENQRTETSNMLTMTTTTIITNEKQKVIGKIEKNWKN